MALPVAMTTADMISAFNIEYDRIIAQVSQSYEDDEILTFLNRSQESTVDELYQNRRFDLLGSLFVSSDIITHNIGNAWAMSNGYYIEKSNTDFSYYPRFITDVLLGVERTGFPEETGFAVSEQIDKVQAKMFVKDGGNSKIIFRNPKFYIDGEYLMILVDSYTTLTEVYPKYIRNPLVLSMDPQDEDHTDTCELNPILHNSIVTKAVYLAKEATDRLQQQQQKQSDQ